MNMEYLGRFLGYPKCCANGFENGWNMKTRHNRETRQGPWAGTGYIPCLECALKIVRNEITWDDHVKMINVRRKASIPFPTDLQPQVCAEIDAWCLQLIAQELDKS